MADEHAIAAVLERVLHRLEHVLPAQAPIQDFVHHNTLHGFQHLPFRSALSAAEEVNGTHGFLPAARFREHYRAGRIDDADLDAALDDTPELRSGDPVLPGIARRAVLVAGLLGDFSGPPATSWAWWMEETGALSRLRPDLASAARAQLLQGRNEAAVVGALWKACAALQRDRPRDEPAPQPTPGEAAELRHQRLLRQEAEARLSELVGGTGEHETMRGLLVRLTGRDVLKDSRSYLIRHLASHLDQGLAAWHNPGRDHGFYAAWRASAGTDPHFGLSALGAWEQTLERLPDTATEAILQSLLSLGIDPSRWERYLERLALELPGWSGMFLWRSLHPGYGGMQTPVDMADYLAVRLILEHVHCQTLCGLHFKTEASLPGLRGYFRRHPAELLVRLALYSDDLPEWLADQGHRLVRAATSRSGEERDAEWLPVARLLAAWRRGEHDDYDVEAGATPPDRRAWTLFVLCEHLGIDADGLAGLGANGANALLGCLDELTPELSGWVWLQAYERHYRERVFAALAANHGRGPWWDRGAAPTPRAQLVFCMDDREEGIRRHLEEQQPDVETLGAAAHFEVFIRYTGLGDARPSNLCPVVARPAHAIREEPAPQSGPDAERLLRRRDRRVAWKERLLQGSRLDPLQGALASVVGAPAALLALVGKALVPAAVGRVLARMRRSVDGQIPTRLDFCATTPWPASPDSPRPGFTDSEQADRVNALLRNTGLTRRFAPLVVIVGHGSNSQNNPHLSAYDCGACAGRHSGPNARLLAAMANREPVRGLLRERGIDIPAGTHFVGCEHNTCDDSFTWLDSEALPPAAAAGLMHLDENLRQAGRLHAQERCRRFASAALDLDSADAVRHVSGRRFDYAQARPELGHVTNAAVFIGRRAATRGVFFDRRMFLISYDATQDPEGRVLEPLLLANGPVGAGISLEYYFSTVNNERYGCGTKVVHNLTGLLGVMEGTSSDLRPGLPRQMIEIHEAMRLLIVIEQTLPVLDALYRRQPALQELIGNGWVQLAGKDPHSGVIHRFLPSRGWVEWRGPGAAVPRAASSGEWTRGRRDHLPPALVEAAIRGAS